ncbi:Hint domain-containing protein [Acidisoma cellulosilytica]|uniref:Hint domain-containing protein n=1 Tax=Acidisoma cellulosilyticum TaxID=2802395 RepID=A0A964E7K7_9PROT|nr:Hint domain-containing protein [Acidisoma cellulosilyticum]MCB8884103.1 Hint domain-containing protein [Acidisoma cellulosilyticum]
MSSYALTEITYPGASATEVSGINAFGVVTGLYIPAGQQTVLSFIWSPADGYMSLPPAPDGGTEVQTVAILNDGAVAGLYEIPNDAGIQNIGFIYQNGAYTIIAPPNAVTSGVLAANSSGELVGYAESEAGFTAYSYMNGVYTTLPSFLNTYQTIPHAVNASGVIVGDMENEQAVTRAFLYDGTRLLDISDPLGVNSVAVAVNATEEVVGQYTDASGNTFSYTYSNGVFAQLGGPVGAQDILATAINDSGTIVGTYTDASGRQLGFVDNNGTYTTVAVDDDPLTEITSINDAGEILGIAESSSNQLYSFTAEPNCFLSGTAIATIAGEQPIETLQIGDLIITADGAVCPIRWIGRRTLYAHGRDGHGGHRIADPIKVSPIRIMAGALGGNLPSRDLFLSPDHAILLNDILIQAGALVNNATIMRLARPPECFTYYHIELTHHALLLAEGIPAESFVDNVDRLGFDNWAEHKALYPNAAPIAEMNVPRAQSYRQIPHHLREQLDIHSRELAGKDRTAA